MPEQRPRVLGSSSDHDPNSLGNLQCVPGFAELSRAGLPLWGDGVLAAANQTGEHPDLSLLYADSLTDHGKTLPVTGKTSPLPHPSAGLKSTSP